MKVCTKCGVEKSFDEFHKNKISKSGYRSWCKECMRLKKLELKKNPLMQLEKQIRSSIILENKILLRDGKKLCTRCKGVFLIEDLASEIICKECNRTQQRKYYKKNKEKIKENRKEYRKEYYKENKEKIREYYEKNKEKTKEYRKEYYEKNKDICSKKGKEYREKNKEIIKERNRQYYFKKKLEKLQNNDTQT